MYEMVRYRTSQIFRPKVGETGFGHAPRLRTSISSGISWALWLWNQIALVDQR